MSNANETNVNETAKVVVLDVSISEDMVKKSVKEFLAKNPKLEWNQRTAAFALAYVMAEVLPLGDDLDHTAATYVDFKVLARFLAQESLHGLACNASQFKQWFFGKEVAKAKVDIDDLAG